MWGFIAMFFIRWLLVIIFLIFGIEWRWKSLRSSSRSSSIGSIHTIYLITPGSQLIPTASSRVVILFNLFSTKKHRGATFSNLPLNAASKGHSLHKKDPNLRRRDLDQLESCLLPGSQSIRIWPRSLWIFCNSSPRRSMPTWQAKLTAKSSNYLRSLVDCSSSAGILCYADKWELPRTFSWHSKMEFRKNSSTDCQEWCST